MCTYHTQLDRYVRFYTAKHSFLDAFKPRIAVQKLSSTFYGGCDVVGADEAPELGPELGHQVDARNLLCHARARLATHCYHTAATGLQRIATGLQPDRN